MSKNPYDPNAFSQPSAYGTPAQAPIRPMTPGYSDDVLLPPPTRTSFLAITSLVLSLICFIPTFSVLAVLLGALSLIFILNSNGRLSGRGFAIGGIVLGLIVTAFQVALLLGASSILGSMLRAASAPYATLETGDVKQFRTYLNTTASSTITDDQIKSFAASVKQAGGKVVPFNGNIITAFTMIRDVSNRFTPNVQNRLNSAQSQKASTGRDFFPLFVEFEKGSAIVLFEFDARSQPQPTGVTFSDFLRGNITNMGLIAPDGREIWLVPDAAPGTNPLLPPSTTPATPTSPDQPALPEKPVKAPAGSV
ncbi:MAG: DUF4190 domain-containing protein [Phycisphaerales bacterium]|nr:DUF4190 domain-containing protein [Phycisphaerales bacterium]